MATTDTAPFVIATMHYTLDNGIPPDYYFYEPDPAITLHPPGTDTREVKIFDGWPHAKEFSVDREGFEIMPFADQFDECEQFDNDTAIRQLFYPQVTEFVKQHTGASRVEVFDHTIRKRLPADLKQQTEVQRPAVMLVHSDYTPQSGPQRVRAILADEAEPLLQGRVAFFNVWKPLYRPVQELPLALCDATSAATDDMLIMQLKYRDRTGQIFVMRYAPSHRWFYFPDMTPEQALLLKTYDSKTDGRARFMGHSAFEDPNTPANALTRESIEVRTMAFF